MAEDNDAVKTIAKKLGWPMSESNIRRLPLEGLNNCDVYDAYDARVLDGASVGVARLSDGDFIISSETNALNSVFSRCTLPTTPTRTLAELIASFSSYAGLRVLHDDQLDVAKILLQKTKRSFAPPEVVTERNARIIRFLALSPDGAMLYQVEASMGENNVTVQANVLAPAALP